jgi:hypothetical protein
MGKSSSSPEPAKAGDSASNLESPAKADRIVRIEGIVRRIQSLPQPDSKTVLDDEAANLAAFLKEGHGETALETEITELLK